MLLVLYTPVHAHKKNALTKQQQQNRDSAGIEPEPFTCKANALPLSHIGRYRFRSSRRLFNEPVYYCCGWHGGREKGTE